jgi:hypothetical protein
MFLFRCFRRIFSIVGLHKLDSHFYGLNDILHSIDHGVDVFERQTRVMGWHKHIINLHHCVTRHESALLFRLCLKIEIALDLNLLQNALTSVSSKFERRGSRLERKKGTISCKLFKVVRIEKRGNGKEAQLSVTSGHDDTVAQDGSEIKWKSFFNLFITKGN